MEKITLSAEKRWLAIRLCSLKKRFWKVKLANLRRSWLSSPGSRWGWPGSPPSRRRPRSRWVCPCPRVLTSGQSCSARSSEAGSWKQGGRPAARFHLVVLTRFPEQITFEQRQVILFLKMINSLLLCRSCQPHGIRKRRTHQWRQFVCWTVLPKNQLWERDKPMRQLLQLRFSMFNFGWTSMLSWSLESDAKQKIEQ